MRLCNVTPVVLVTIASSLPGFAWAQAQGATRIPPQVRALKAAPESAPPAEASDQQRSNAPDSQRIGGHATDPGAARIERTSDGLAPPGGVYGLEAGPLDSDGQGHPAGGTTSTPDVHVVQKGDTLWTLCAKYFADPWRWPQLWASNPSITNPHWIFPGDIVRLGPGSSTAPAAEASSALAPDDGRRIASNRAAALASNAVSLREIGFIEAQDLELAATVGGSREEKIMLATGDQAYLRFPKQRPLRAGERYTVFETDFEHPVRDPETGKTYGYLVRIRGDMMVDQIAGEGVARASLTDVMEPIERGNRVSAAVRQFKRIEPRPSDVSLEARVVAAFTPTLMLAAENFVVLNRGRRDGVQVGNRVYVIRQGDGYRGILESWEHHDPRFPKEVVGEIWVVDVRDNASVAWVARSSKELRVGEITEMKKGY